MLAHLRRPGIIPAIMLLIIVAWALLAVVMLTNTLVSARQIDNRVEVINSEVGPIDNDLDSVVLARKTGEISGRIRAAAVPLGGQLTATNESVKGIDSSAESILARAELINGSAKDINASVQQINANVTAIGSTLNSVEGSAESINGSVDGITASFDATLSEVVSIDDGAAGINRRANTVTSQAQEIAADLDTVTNVLVPAIITNSEAIEGSPLLLNDVDAAGILNQVAAAQALQAPEPSASQPAVPLPVPDIADLTAPLEAPELPIGEPLLSGPQQPSDTGSILGSVVGGL